MKERMTTFFRTVDKTLSVVANLATIFGLGYAMVRVFPAIIQALGG